MYKVEVTSKSGYSFIAKSKDAELVIDLKGGGMTPPDTLLASLGSCIGVYIRKYAEGARLAIGEFKITIDSDLGAEAPYRFRHINVLVDLPGSQLDQKRKDAIADFIKNCPVHNTLENKPVVDIRID